MPPAMEFEFDVEAGQEITLKVMPIDKGIAQPVLLGSYRMLANRLEHASTRYAQVVGKDRSDNDVAEEADCQIATLD